MFHENLYQLRKKHDYTIKGLAMTLGVARSTYEGWESGHRLPDLERLKQIIDMFGVEDMYTFVYGDGKKNIIRLSNPIKKKDR